jgi:hypothetical protein
MPVEELVVTHEVIETASDVEQLREHLKTMSTPQLHACTRVALQNCRADAWKGDPRTPEEILLAEARAEWRRRCLKQPRRYTVSKGLDFLDL